MTTRIILCSINDRVHTVEPMYTITVKRCANLRSLDMFAPTREMVYGHKHFCGDARFLQYPKVSNEQYTDAYRTLIMARLPRIARWYQALPVADDFTCTLCCYCAPGMFCHRQLVFKTLLWLNGKLNVNHTVELY